MLAKGPVITMNQLKFLYTPFTPVFRSLLVMNFAKIFEKQHENRNILVRRRGRGLASWEPLIRHGISVEDLRFPRRRHQTDAARRVQEHQACEITQVAFDNISEKCHFFRRHK